MLFVFAILAFVQISFWISIWIGIRRTTCDSSIEKPGESRPVSVVVAVRDEVAAIDTLLDSLSDQVHPDFEVILVDDGSGDGSVDLISDRCDRDPRFRIVKNPNNRRGKKGAVSTGIAEARFDLIVLTDADCRPGPEWLSAIARAHGERAEIVVGYGPYSREKSMLNRLIRYETLATAMMTAGAIGFGHPYMAVGRNLSYPREVANMVGRRSRGTSLLSGDDDLLVQEASKSGFPVRYLLDPGSFVESDAPSTFRAWFRQKRRHVSASRSYRIPAAAALVAFHGSSLSCWIAPLVIGLPGVFFLVVKFAAQWPAVASAASRFGEKGLVALLPLLDLMWLVMLLVVSPVGVVFPPKKW